MTTPSSLRRAALSAVCALTALLLGGCGGPADAGSVQPVPSSPVVDVSVTYRTIAEPTLRPGDAIPEPTGPVVLRVRGSEALEPVAFDMSTLERLGLVEYTVDDKQAEGRRVAFRGVLLRSLLEAAGATQGTVVRATALNDYQVDIPVSDTVDYPVMVATQVDGQRMSVERYGPTRVVYPTESYDLDPTVYDPRWIWQLATIEVR